MQFLFWAAPIQQHDCQLRVVWRSMLWDETKHQAYFVVDKTYSHDAAASCIRFGGQSVPRHSLPLAQKAHTTHNHIIYHMYIYIHIYIYIYIYTYILYTLVPASKCITQVFAWCTAAGRTEFAHQPHQLRFSKAASRASMSFKSGSAFMSLLL